MNWTLVLTTATMTKRLFVDIKEDCKGNLTGPVKFPADGAFVFEAILLVIEEFANSVKKPPNEVIQDMYNFKRLKETK